MSHVQIFVLFLKRIYNGEMLDFIIIYYPQVWSGAGAEKNLLLESYNVSVDISEAHSAHFCWHFTRKLFIQLSLFSLDWTK